MKKNILTAALVLGICAIVGTALVATSYQLTAAQIEANERRVLLNRLNVLVPPDAYNNALFKDTTEFVHPQWLGTVRPVTVYRARWDGEAVAAVFTSVAPDGYSGAIRLLVAINVQGEVIGVRVFAHQETPGLGDKIEAQRSDWILQFNQRSLDNPVLATWQVSKDGGAFDQLTSATITSRAVVKAVRNTLQFFKQHHAQVFSPEM